MAKIDQRLVELLKKYGEDNTAVWDCHGTWIAYHSAVERMAAKAGIKFGMPQLVVNDLDKKSVVILVEAEMGEAREWSFGEATPANNKNAYPYAMAEKRAKDRVALKLLGMSGLVYSEEEADDFKASKPLAPAGETKEQPKRSSRAQMKKGLDEITRDLMDCHSVVAVNSCAKTWASKFQLEGWTKDFIDEAKPRFAARREALAAKTRDEINGEIPDTIGEIANQFSGARVVDERVQHPLEAGE